MHQAHRLGGTEKARTSMFTILAVFVDPPDPLGAKSYSNYGFDLIR